MGIEVEQDEVRNLFGDASQPLETIGRGARPMSRARQTVRQGLGDVTVVLNYEDVRQCSPFVDRRSSRARAHRWAVARSGARR